MRNFERTSQNIKMSPFSKDSFHSVLHVLQPTFTQQPPISKSLFTIVMLVASDPAAGAVAKAAEPPPKVVMIS